jgi:hypothetical protein
LDRDEIALLRTLPRIPEVTLATGLPVDQTLPPGGLLELRETTIHFASNPFDYESVRPLARPPLDLVGETPQEIIRLNPLPSR